MGSSKSGNRTASPRRAKKRGALLNCRNVVGTEVFDLSALTKTDTVSLSLQLLDRVVAFAHQGDETSIEVLKELGVAIIEHRIEPITVLQPNGDVAAWIV